MSSGAEKHIYEPKTAKDPKADDLPSSGTFLPMRKAPARLRLLVSELSEIRRERHARGEAKTLFSTNVHAPVRRLNDGAGSWAKEKLQPGRELKTWPSSAELDDPEKSLQISSSFEMGRISGVKAIQLLQWSVFKVANS